MDNKQLEIQLKRLKKNYTLSCIKYDPINFLDLINALRIWTEIKNENNDIVKNIQIIQNPFIRIKKIIKKYQYVHAHFQNPITTTIEATGEKDERELCFYPDYGQPFTIAFLMQKNGNNLTTRNFTFIHKDLSAQESAMLDKETRNMITKNVSLSEYLDSSAASFNFLNINEKNISRVNLIKRLANEYDASHLRKNPSDYTNMFSPIIAELMKYGYSTLPLPYFLSLQIANDIIEASEKEFKKINTFL